VVDGDNPKAFSTLQCLGIAETHFRKWPKIVVEIPAAVVLMGAVGNQLDL
jgi:hypothetical protein